MSKTYFIKVTNGKFTIPKELRDKYNLLPGTKIKADIKNGSLVLNFEKLLKN